MRQETKVLNRKMRKGLEPFLKKACPKIDVLLTDVDEVFVRHRTVAVASQLFLESWCVLFGKRFNRDRMYSTGQALRLAAPMAWNVRGFRFNPGHVRRVIILSLAGATLYALSIVRGAWNRWLPTFSLSLMVRGWARCVLLIRPSIHDVSLTKKAIIGGRRMHHLLKKIKKANPGLRIATISCHFSGLPHSSVLGCEIEVANRWDTDLNGRVVGARVAVSNPGEKRLHALKAAKLFRARSIGVIIDDWDDLGMAGIPGVSLIIHHKRLTWHLRKFKAQKVQFG